MKPIHINEKKTIVIDLVTMPYFEFRAKYQETFPLNITSDDLMETVKTLGVETKFIEQPMYGDEQMKPGSIRLIQTRPDGPFEVFMVDERGESAFDRIHDSLDEAILHKLKLVLMVIQGAIRAVADLKTKKRGPPPEE